ncbi:putative ubiquitin-conjugating enzyme E2 33, variant 2 [Lathyrus oleraceus]|uniref:Ubiquitin-conjugating enzyme E2 33, variant 2 n=1 Tax=Pisum sativum TaxID=3888 RepID=A0A9D4XJK0_PEA|nr:putative ubiquitin-conjugating enzyme E2 33, variant 2 [Pisum sativum]
MADKACIKRLQKEYRALCKEPVSHIVARPSPSDILEWHYVLEGSEGTPFSGGFYYGKIKFPPEYPYKPPGISILTGLLSFMMDTSPTTGSVNTTIAEKQRLAKSSLSFNCKNATFRKMFPEYVEKYEQQQLSEQTASEQRVSSDSRHDKSSNSVSERNLDSAVEDMKKVEGLKDMRRNRKQAFPTWMMLLLFSIFGVVMALPLLQL